MMNEQEGTNSTTDQRWSQPILLGCVAILVIASIFLIGLGLGYGVARWTDPSLAGDFVGSGASGLGVGTGNARRQLGDDVGLMWEALDLLYRDYYGELPEDEDAIYGAIRGVLGEVDDPNTSFLSPEEAEFFRTGIQGSFEGIGAGVTWDTDFDTVRVTEPFEGQPAWNAGIQRDDLILAVDGEEIIGTNLTDAIMLIRGERGTTVVLNIAREGEDEPFDVEVTRDRIELPVLEAEQLGDDGEFAYIKLGTFNDEAGQLVRDAMEDALADEPEGIIFDLRGNGGGLLREAVKVASVFLEDQNVLIERFSDGDEKIYETSGRALGTDLPIVILVNGGSASASEIVAGAIQDAERGTLIGETTFGKGSVQLPHQLSDGSIMRVTIARWYTPEDRTIDRVGLEPDIEIERSREDYENEEDPQLDAALEYLEELTNQ